MDVEYSQKTQNLMARLNAFMADIAAGDRWQPTTIMEELKSRVQAGRGSPQ